MDCNTNEEFGGSSALVSPEEASTIFEITWAKVTAMYLAHPISLPLFRSGGIDLGWTGRSRTRFPFVNWTRPHAGSKC